MRRYVLKRLVLGVITIIGVSIIVFVSARLSGDVALLLAPTGATEEQIQEIRARFGLDKPIPVQYVVFVKNALHGEFGDSITYQRPAMDIMFERFPATIELGIWTFIVSNILGILMGVFSAMKPTKWIEMSSQIFVLLGQAMPAFWLAVMLMLVFSVKLHWLPTSGRGSFSHLILPLVSMAWLSTSFVMRITRSALLDVLDSEYIKMARIKGNSERVVIWKHALKNALIPVITMAGMQLTMLIGGMVFIEQIFRWPGVGELMVNSINARDYPLIQAITLVLSVGIICINLIVDLVFVFIDPRIKYE